MADNQQRQPDNGNRMDRFERGLEHLLAAQAKHEASAETRFQRAEARMDTLNEALTRLVGVVDHLAEAQRVDGEETDRRFRETAERFRDTDERLNALIKTVDEMIRRRPPEAPST
jgi:hypothetical protein